MYYTVIYKNLSTNQKKNIISFISSNFNNIPESSLGLEPNTIIIVNYENEKILGCVCLLNDNDLKKKLFDSNVPLKYYSFNEKSCGLFLYNLCVDKKFRNKKIGNELIELSIKFAKDVNIDFLHCQAENEISKLIFTKNKFFEVSSFMSTTNNLTYLMNLYV